LASSGNLFQNFRVAVPNLFFARVPPSWKKRTRTWVVSRHFNEYPNVSFTLMSISRTPWVIQVGNRYFRVFQNKVQMNSIYNRNLWEKMVSLSHVSHISNVKKYHWMMSVILGFDWLIEIGHSRLYCSYTRALQSCRFLRISETQNMELMVEKQLLQRNDRVKSKYFNLSNRVFSF
jgi:hypothetical protein